MWRRGEKIEMVESVPLKTILEEEAPTEMSEQVDYLLAEFKDNWLGDWLTQFGPKTNRRQDSYSAVTSSHGENNNLHIKQWLNTVQMYNPV